MEKKTYENEVDKKEKGNIVKRTERKIQRKRPHHMRCTMSEIQRLGIMVIFGQREFRPSQSFASSAGLDAIRIERHAGIEPKSGCVTVGVEEGIKIEVLQEVRLLECGEIDIEPGRLHTRQQWPSVKLAKYIIWAGLTSGMERSLKACWFGS